MRTFAGFGGERGGAEPKRRSGPAAKRDHRRRRGAWPVGTRAARRRNTAIPRRPARPAGTRLRAGATHGQRAAMRQAIEDIELEIDNLRAIITDLRPSLLDDLGLLPAIEALVERRRKGGLRDHHRASSSRPRTADAHSPDRDDDLSGWCRRRSRTSSSTPMPADVASCRWRLRTARSPSRCGTTAGLRPGAGATGSA